jgi:hypothetical protein
MTRTMTTSALVTIDTIAPFDMGGNTNYSAAFRKSSFVVVAECEERESSLVPRISVVDADHA